MILFCLALALSLDALSVGASLGFKKIRFTRIALILIFLMSSMMSLLSLKLGAVLNQFLSPRIAEYLGEGLLILMGFYMIFSYKIKKPSKETAEKQTENFEEKTLFELAVKSLGITFKILKNPERGDKDCSGCIDTREALAFGFALSIDMFGIGIGLSAFLDNLTYFPILIGFTQVLFLKIGSVFGSKIAGKFSLSEQLASSMAGLFLIVFSVIKIVAGS